MADSVLELLKARNNSTDIPLFGQVTQIYFLSYMWKMLYAGGSPQRSTERQEKPV